ncbi:choice-of-anchor D domain-containing protein [candidate division KSB1 bacterium]|nr:choice-of-anchor D domain-containing protein [candidate division KSB1 bacterium]
MSRSTSLYFAVAFLLFTQAVSFSDEIRITLTNQNVDFLADKNGYARFAGKDITYLNSTGEPNIPSKVLNVLLPPDVDFSSISVTLVDKRLESIAGEWDVPPVPQLAAKVEGQELLRSSQKLRDGRDIAIYLNNTPFPQQLVGSIQSGAVRKYRLVHIPVALFQYRPLDKKLYRLDRAEIRIQFDRKPDSNFSFKAFDPVADKWIADKVDNYYDMKREYGSMSLRETAPQGGTGYVILTTSTIKNGSEKLAAFVVSKQLRGFDVSVVTENEWGGGNGDTAAENIRSWLQDNYLTKNIEYVLIIGNPDPDNGDLAMKRLWPRNNQTFYTQYLDSPSDYYFADLTGNWDKDNDGKYGEMGKDQDFGPGGVDLNFDVVVGRIPCYGIISDLDKILAKITAYENESQASASWRKNVLLPMEPSDSSTPGYHLGEQIATGIVNPKGGWDRYRIYDLDFNVNPEKTPCDISSVKAAWTSDKYGAVFWWTHGTSTIASDVMNASTAATLNDNFPSFTFQCSCHNANPDASSNLAYSLLKNGAIATVGATRVSWYYRGQTYFSGSPSNAGLTFEYASRLISKEMTCGYALYDLKQALNFFQDAELWMNFTDFNLYGDPSIGLFTWQTAAVQKPEITVMQNGTSIPVSGSFDFGVQEQTGGKTGFVFTVNNIGTADLSLTGSPAVQISGENAGNFIVSDQPGTFLPPSSSQNFRIEFAPAGAGDYSAVVSIPNNDVKKDPYTFNLHGTVTAETHDMLVVNTGSLPPAFIGNSYEAQCQASGGEPPYKWSLVNGHLPVGLTLNISGQICGKPDAAGDFSFTVKVQDNAASPAETVKSLTLSVNFSDEVDEEFTTGSLGGYKVLITKPGPEIETKSVPGYVRMSLPADDSFDHWKNTNSAPQLRRSACPGDWTIETKLKLTETTGTCFHTGLIVYFSVLDIYYWGFNGNEKTLKLSRTGNGNLIKETYKGGTEVELRIRKEDTVFYFEYRSPGEEKWIECGSQTTSDVPQEYGLIAKTWGKQVLKADFDYLRVNTSVEELVILTESLPDGSVNDQYNVQLNASGGAPPYKWSLVSGTLPEGLTLTEQGVINGTLRQSGLYDFTIRVICSGNPNDTKARKLSVKVVGSPGIDEEFTTGTLEGYTQHIPVAGPVFDLESQPGYLRLMIPRKYFYDHWKNADRAPQLRRFLDQKDWCAETKVRIAETTGTKFHVGLMVYFSQYDVFYWGFNSGTKMLKMSRAGKEGLIIENYNGGDEVELRIVKEGDKFDFLYRESGAAQWISAGQYSEPNAPVSVGLIGKIWEKMELLADFDYLRIICDVSQSTGEQVAGLDTDDNLAAVPENFSVSQAYPNPFNPSTCVTISLVEPGDVTVSVFNVRGQVVRNLYTGHRPAGVFNTIWDARDNNGTLLQSGSYYMRIKINDQVFYRKLLLVK